MLAKSAKRAFLGWLRGEPKHCSMAAIPTIEDEDTRRPSREREGLVKERTRIINRLKANLARLGIRGFRPSLAQASSRLETLRTPEGAPVPANTLAELRRDMARLHFVKQQIKDVEATRAKRLQRTFGEGRDAMVRLRGGGNPICTMVFEPRFRMGPPPRSFAADAHDCIMVAILTDRPNTSLWRDVRA